MVDFHRRIAAGDPPAVALVGGACGGGGGSKSSSPATTTQAASSGGSGTGSTETAAPQSTDVLATAKSAVDNHSMQLDVLALQRAGDHVNLRFAAP